MHILRSPLIRWHLRHVLLLWAGARILVSMVLAWSASSRHYPSVALVDLVTGPPAGLVALPLTVALVLVDGHRIGAPLYFANLGYTLRWQLVTAAMLCAIAEGSLQLATFVLTHGTSGFTP